jgi:hypothetical protein
MHQSSNAHDMADGGLGEVVKSHSTGGAIGAFETLLAERKNWLSRLLITTNVVGFLVLCISVPCMAVDMSIEDTLTYINARIAESIAHGPPPDGERTVGNNLALKNGKLIYTYSYSTKNGPRRDNVFKAPVKSLNAENIDVASGGEGIFIACIGLSDVKCVHDVRETGGSTSHTLGIKLGRDMRLSTKIKNALAHLIRLAQKAQQDQDKKDPF